MYSIAQIREIIDDGLQSSRLSAWECRFLSNIDASIVPKGKFYQLTPKQEGVLSDIEVKLYSI